MDEDVQPRLALVQPPHHEPADVVRAITMAENVLAMLPLCLSELYHAMVSAIGYGTANARLRAFCRVLQKRLERR